MDLEISWIGLKDIVESLNKLTQQRVKMDIVHVDKLAESLNEVEDLAPIDVIFDEEKYWVIDGFHRILAYQKAKKDVIPAYVTQGTQRDAILASVAANAENLCLPRTKQDKEKAVKVLLDDPEWSQWSDRRIARQVKVSPTFVSTIRKSYLSTWTDRERTCSRNGKSYTINTSKIGGGFKDGDYGCSQKPNINDWTAKGGHLIPKSVLGEMDSPSSGSSCAQKPIEIDLKEIFLAFMANYEDFPPDYKTAIKNRIAEIDQKLMRAA